MKKLTQSLNSLFDRLELLWMVLGFVYLGIYAYQVIARPSASVWGALEWASVAIYGLFVVELVVRILGSWASLWSIQGFLAFLRTHWLSLLAVILPAFRALRVLRVVIVLKALEPFLTKRTHKLSVTTTIVMPLLLFMSAVSVLEAEQDAPGANITSFPDALWWALASITTVGYGDRFPVTADGRMVAVFLMIIGIGLFGSLTALFAAWVMSEDRTATRASGK